MTPKQILTQARELISDPKRWTKGYFAKTALGAPCGSLSDRAICWCISGAINKVSEFKNHQVAYDRLRLVVGPLITQFNDDPKTTHADVIAAFDRAIEHSKIQ